MKKRLNQYQIYAFITICCWALAYVFTGDLMQHFTAFSLGLLRYAIATIVFLILLIFHRQELPQKGDWKWLFLSGMCGYFLYSIVFNIGMTHASAAMGSLIVACTPIITALISNLLHREKLPPHQKLTLAAALLGVFVLLWDGSFTLDKGVLWLLAAAFVLSCYNVIQHRLSKRYNALQITIYSTFSGTLCLSLFLPQALPALKAIPRELIVPLLIVGILSSALAYASWSKAMTLAPSPVSVSAFMFLTPLITALISFCLKRELPDLKTVVSGIIILGSMLLFQKKERSVQS